MSATRKGVVGRYGAEYASPRPWTVEFVSHSHHAVVRGADGACVCVCHADNAALIVEAANQFICPTAGHGQEPKPQRLECPPDLQAARADADTGN